MFSSTLTSGSSSCLLTRTVCTSCHLLLLSTKTVDDLGTAWLVQETFMFGTCANTTKRNGSSRRTASTWCRWISIRRTVTCSPLPVAINSSKSGTYPVQVELRTVTWSKRLRQLRRSSGDPSANITSPASVFCSTQALLCGTFDAPSFPSHRSLNTRTASPVTKSFSNLLQSLAFYVFYIFQELSGKVATHKRSSVAVKMELLLPTLSRYM